jgi:alginate O-acetyltransferase complex protein AlgI
MLFILFFPHLVAGPIVRARDFLPQVRRAKRWDWPRLHLGMQYVIMGLFKKFAIADRMALFADPVFARPHDYGTGALWVAVLAYTLQLYCDFSGYSDMALGTAHMLGYKLSKNFDMPYVSANMAEFWRRWHISLSTWLRDYLFVPLGGSRGSRWKTYRNLLIVMTLGGLWHGARWSFVVFGIIQGAGLVVQRWFRGFCELRPGLDQALRTGPGTLCRIALTMLFFSCSLVVFRTMTLAEGAGMLGRMMWHHRGQGPPMQDTCLWYTLAFVVLCHLAGQDGRWKNLYARVPAPVRGLVYAAVLTISLVMAPQMEKAFIYFQF